MIWVFHTLGSLAWFAVALGVAAGFLSWAASSAWFRMSDDRVPIRGPKIPVVTTATVTLAVAILGVSPGSNRRFPAQGEFEGWHWRWLGDLPDAVNVNLMDDYTAAIAVLNFALFVGWGVVMAWGFGARGRAWVVTAAVLFPVCLEIFQRYPFGGTPSVTDAWTNILGGLCGVGLWMVWIRAATFVASHRAPRRV